MILTMVALMSLTTTFAAKEKMDKVNDMRSTSGMSTCISSPTL